MPCARVSVKWSRVVPLVLVAAACGDNGDGGGIVGPPGTVTVAVTVSRVSQPLIEADDQLNQVIHCDVTLRATAAGNGDAAWRGATLRWYAGADRTAPLDTSAIPEAYVRDTWGGDSITAGSSQDAQWQIWAYAPFALEFVFRYEPTRATAPRTASARFTCGPDIPAGGAPLPEITGLSVQAPPGVLEPGDTITVQYAATSTLGLWETRLGILGPCLFEHTFGEALAKSASRAVPVALPAECALGIPINVGLAVRDGALQERTRLNTTTLLLQDVTPPRLQILSFPSTGGSLTEGIDGTVFVGDTIRVWLLAEDNHDLEALVWEMQPAGLRDSLLTSGTGAGPWLAIPTRPEWTGTQQMRFWARDAVGLISDTVPSGPGPLRILPTVVPQAVTATVVGQVVDAAIDQQRGVLYLLEPPQRQVLVLNTATLATLRTIPTTVAPEDIDLFPGGDSLILTLPDLGALGIVDLRAASPAVAVHPLTTLDTARGQRPLYVRTTADGKAFVRLTGNEPATWTLLEVDLSTGTETVRTDAGNGGYVGPALLERSHDHTALVLQGPESMFQRYDVGTNAFGSRQSAIPSDARPSVDASGAYTAVGIDVYDQTLAFVREVESMVPPNAALWVPAALHPTGASLYHVLPPWGILRSRVSDGVLLDRMPTPLSATLLRASANGTLLVEVENTWATTSRIRVVTLP